MGPYPPSFVEFDRLDDHRNSFVLQDEDVLVNTYPKCGTAWTQQIVGLLLKTITPDALGDQLSNKMWTEKTAGSGETCADELNKEAKGQPRVLKSHGPYPLKPYQKMCPKAKVVYCARNIKDCCVSMYFHALRIPQFEFDGDFNTFQDIFLRGLVEFGDWFDHTIEWWKASQEKPEQILFITYEDLKLSPVQTIKKIAEFLELKDISDETVEMVRKASSFDSMKEQHVKESDSKKLNYSIQHFRKGEVGDWKNYFTINQNAAYDAMYAKRMAEVPDLKFVFDSNETEK